MRAFDSDHFVLPLPDGHKFPMAKYAKLRADVDAIVTIHANAIRVASGHDRQASSHTAWHNTSVS